MAGLSISPPGVEVIQEFVSTSPTAITPFLPTVFVGPAQQVISAFDDLGNPLADAFAGTYRDGEGQIAYDLPSLVAEASLIGFEEDVRVFLLSGTEVTELNAEDGEEFIVSDGIGDFSTGTPDTLTDVTQLFAQIGVEEGDFLRVTYLAEVVDIEITSVTDTVLDLASSVIGENLVALDYDIVRNPAQFVFDSVAQANVETGTSVDFLRITAQLLETDLVTPAEYIGSRGDDLSMVVTDSERFVEGPDLAIGTSVFSSTAAPFVSIYGPIGPVASGFFVVVGDATAPTNGLVLRDVQGVGGVNFIAIEPGETPGGGQTFRNLQETFSGTDAISAGTTVTSAIGGFLAIPLVGAAPAAPTSTTLIEIAGDGVYEITLVTDDNTVTVGAATTGVGPVAFVVCDQLGALQTDGVVATLDTVLSISVGGFTALPSPTTKSVNVGESVARDILTVDAGRRITTSSPFPSSAVGQAFSIVETTVPVDLSFEPDLDQITFKLARATGLTTNPTLLQVLTILTDVGNPNYNIAVADVVTAALGGTLGDGSTLLDISTLPLTLQFDGGSDEEQLLLDADLLGSGTPTAQVYVSYKALRVDLSAASTSFEKALFIENQDQRELLLGAATVDNPLSLAVSFGLINSPTQGVFALGVGEVSAAKPEGTVAAYTEAFEALEPQDVHLIVPLTQDLTVAQIQQVHVGALSAPDQKSERIGFFNSPMPDFKKAEVIASGTEGNGGLGTGGTPLQMTGFNPASFRTSVDLALAGAAPGDFLVVTAFAGPSSELTAVDGTVGPLYGLEVVAPATQLGDDFVLQVDASGLTDTSFDSLIDVNWTLYRAGTAITQATDQAEVIAQTSEGFLDRRMFHHWPDKVTADVDGTEFLLPGYYAMSGWGGKANQTAPEQGFSNGTIAGYTGIKNSNGYFNKGQLDRIAGGGTWITVQDSQNAPLKCRHQLSTDTTAVEKREFSITRVVDYVAKYLRLGLNRQVGRFNITKSYLDGLSVTIQGLLLSLEESGKLVAASLVSVAVDDVEPDKINVVVAIDVPFPANFIEITLQI